MNQEETLIKFWAMAGQKLKSQHILSYTTYEKNPKNMSDVTIIKPYPSRFILKKQVWSNVRNL